MNPLEPSGFRPAQPGTEPDSLKRIGDLLLRGGLTAQDKATLKTSQDLLARIFQAPDLPRRPYGNIPLVGFWVERIRRHWRPDVVEGLLADYAHRYGQARKRALMEARVRTALWKKLCRDRGNHLRPAIQSQLEEAINQAVMADPLWAVECVSLLSQPQSQSQVSP